MSEAIHDLIAKAKDQAIEAYRGTPFGNFLLAERAIFAGVSQWWADYQMRDRLVP